MRKNPLRRAAKRLTAPSPVVERAKRIKRITETRKVLFGLKLNQPVSGKTLEGGSFSGKYRGRMGSTMFIEKPDGSVSFVSMQNVGKLFAKKP